MNRQLLRDSRLQAPFDAMASRIREVAEDRPILFFVNPGNWGDSLIREGAEEFLRQYEFSYRLIRFKDIIKNRRRVEDEIKSVNHANPVMIYNGCGAFTPHYSSLVTRIAELSNNFSTSIFLPSTYAVDMARCGFSSNSIFFVRDKFESQQMMPQAQFCHDMAFFLNPEPKHEGDGDVWCLRRDAEMPAGSKLPYNNVDISRLGRAHTPVAPLFDRLSLAKRIYTNRLHLGIAGALLGREVQLFANDYFKIRAIFHSSIEPHFPNVQFNTAPQPDISKPQRWYHRWIYR